MKKNQNNYSIDYAYLNDNTNLQFSIRADIEQIEPDSMKAICEKSEVPIADIEPDEDFEEMSDETEHDGEQPSLSDHLLKSPMMPKEVFGLLPRVLKEGSDMFKTRREKDIFLTSAITVLSGCFPSIHGVYDRKKVHANLYSFIIAPAASGKGALTGAKDLAQEIHNELVVSQSDGQSCSGEQSSRSPQRLLYIPGNVSAAAMVSLLRDNGGVGIICETEADSMNNALKQDWGGFSDVLRKAFHHEPVSYSRKLKNEYIEINKPKLSVSLSGTPGQVSGLIKSIDDGLFSRFIFYIFRNRPAWKDVSPIRSMPEYESCIADLQHDIKSIYEFMKDLDYSFDLTVIQWNRLNTQYTKTLRDSVTFIGHETSSTVMRLGLIQFRIAMTLSILRHFENSVASNRIVCSDVDYSTAEVLSEAYLKHALLVYKILTKQLESGLGKNMDKLLKALPIIPFRRKDAVDIGEKIGIPGRTVTNYLKSLLENKFLTQEKPQGLYQRVLE